MVGSGFFTLMAEGEARTAWKCAIPARCGWFCGSCAAPYDALSPMEDGGREMTHRHSCSRSVFVGKSLDIILSGDGKIDIIRYNYHVYTSVQSVPPKDFMSGKDANTMKKHIGRFLSVLLCLQLLFGMIPLPGLEEHDHDHEHGLGGIVLPVNAWDTTSECEFCNAFIADDYICDCGEGGDHCSAESGRSCYENVKNSTVKPTERFREEGVGREPFSKGGLF